MVKIPPNMIRFSPNINSRDSYLEDIKRFEIESSFSQFHLRQV
jgi:hypothetical protein